MGIKLAQLKYPAVGSGYFNMVHELTEMPHQGVAKWFTRSLSRGGRPTKKRQTVDDGKGST